MRRIGWMTIVLGIILAAMFVGGLTHPVSPQVPSTIASYDTHHRWVVLGFTLSMAGATILVVTEMLRRNQKPERSGPPADA